MKVRIEWADVRVGAVATALLFTMRQVTARLYLGKAQDQLTEGQDRW